MKVYHHPYGRYIKTRYAYLTSPYPSDTGVEFEAARNELLSLGDGWTPADVDRVISKNPNWARWAEPDRPFCTVCDQEIGGAFVDLEIDTSVDGFVCLPCAKNAVGQMETIAQKKG